MSGDGAPIGADLTPREREVLAMVAAGMTNREIGAALFISESTAGVHVSDLMAKLGVGSRAEVAGLAHRAGLVESGVAVPPEETSAVEQSPSSWWGQLSRNLQQQIEQDPRRVAAAGIGGLAVLFFITVGLALAVLGGAPVGRVADPMASGSTAPSPSAAGRPRPSLTPPAEPSILPSGTSHPSPTASSRPTSTSTPPLTSGPWTATGSMLVPRASHTATLLTDGRVLVAGGYNESSGTASLTSAELYDPATRSWTATGSMTTGHTRHTATLLPDGRVLVVDSSGVSPSAELYNPRTGTWTPTGDLALAHELHAAVLLADGTVLVAGGPPGSMVRSTPAEVYNPRTGSWTAVGSLHVGRHALTLTPLPDGTVLAVGGVRDSQDPATAMAAERYDPASRTWSFTGDMLHLRVGHTATPLPDGVLVTGGIRPTSGYGDTTDPTMTAAEVYDPVTNAWRAAGRLIEARRGHTASLLPGGTILMIGGGATRGELGAEEPAPPEVYDPATRSSADTPRMVHEYWYQPTATLLLDGTVLVTGGSARSTGIFLGALAETFDPTW